MIKKRPIYFDYMATTPVDPRVIAKMVAYLGPDDCFGNPSSTSHIYGQEAARAVEKAREQVAQVIGASSDEIFFTSGATEANNLAILGAVRFYQRKGRHLVTMRTEHKSVLDCFVKLEHEGFEVTYLDPELDGLLSMMQLKQALRRDTIFVSVMHVNNETGVVQDIAAIGEQLRGQGILFHVDASQSAGRLSINLRQLHVDLMSFSGHKNYAPKGVGALYVRGRPRIRLQPQTWGGEQQAGLRAGTLPTHQIVGMGEAFVLTESIRTVEQALILSLRQQLWTGIKDLPKITLNGHSTQRIAGNLNLSFAGFDGATLMTALHDLAISAASACLSAKVQPSYVLRAMGLSLSEQQSAIRLSLGRFTTQEHVLHAIQSIRGVFKS